MDELTADGVLVYLRKHKIVTHMVRQSHYGNRLVVYVEAGLGQLPMAEELLREISTDVELVAPGIVICSREAR